VGRLTGRGMGSGLPRRNGYPWDGDFQDSRQRGHARSAHYGGWFEPRLVAGGKPDRYDGANVGFFARLQAVRQDGTPVKLPSIEVLREGVRARFLPNGSGLVYLQGLPSGQTHRRRFVNDGIAVRLVVEFCESFIQGFPACDCDLGCSGRENAPLGH
jgi:hypothetical protein